MRIILKKGKGFPMTTGRNTGCYEDYPWSGICICCTDNEIAKSREDNPQNPSRQINQNSIVNRILSMYK